MDVARHTPCRSGDLRSIWSTAENACQAAMSQRIVGRSSHRPPRNLRADTGDRPPAPRSRNGGLLAGTGSKPASWYPRPRPATATACPRCRSPPVSRRGRPVIGTPPERSAPDSSSSAGAHRTFSSSACSDQGKYRNLRNKAVRENQSVNGDLVSISRSQSGCMPTSQGTHRSPGSSI